MDTTFLKIYKDGYQQKRFIKMDTPVKFINRDIPEKIYKSLWILQ